MSLAIISIARIAAAGALLPLAALARSAPAATVAPPVTPLCKDDETDCSPHPFDIVAIYALHWSARR